jgi:hypothetical protein
MTDVTATEGHTGVIVVTEVMKLNTTKTVKFFVRHNPSHMVAVSNTRSKASSRRFTKSPRGQRNTKPVAYPACATVGIIAASF